MTNEILKDLKHQYLKEHASILDLIQCYPQLRPKEIMFLLEGSGVKLRAKNETKTAKKLRNRFLAEKHKPSEKQLRALFQEYGNATRVWIVAFKDKNVSPEIVKEWAREIGIGRVYVSRKLSKEERMRRILGKINDNSVK